MADSNETGERASRKAAMEAFDRLPKTLRQEIASANRNWSPLLFMRLRGEKMHCRDLVRLIRDDEKR